MADPLPTLTLAEIYQRQGLQGRARDIYRRLVETGSVEQRREAARRLYEMAPPARETIDLLEVLLARVRDRRRPRETLQGPAAPGRL
jgi:hypothetical protein